MKGELKAIARLRISCILSLESHEGRIERKASKPFIFFTAPENLMKGELKDTDALPQQSPLLVGIS